MSRTLDKTQAAASAKSAPKPSAKPKESARDLVEQLVVAFILAVLIKGFVAEAFVIPTGSMAPTLYGQHKEITCPHCGEVFGVNAADETEERGGGTIGSATCLNCRGPIKQLAKDPSFKGDRILVMKFLYSLPSWMGGQKPSRWDVVVFHYPEDPEQNYIKRLVGLPNEILRIYFGDLWSRPLGPNAPFQILRKPLAHQLAMQQMVYDDSHRPKPFESFPEWIRWQGDQGASTQSDKGRYLIVENTKAKWGGIRYHHFVPDPAQWAFALDKTDPGKPRASLITDYYAYQTGVDAARRSDMGNWFKPNWVGDLTLSAKVHAASSKPGKARVELIEGGVANVCEVDLKTGLATLLHGGKMLGEPVQTAWKADDQDHDLTFANVDDRLTLWIDGKTPFGEGLIYEGSADSHPAPTVADLSPAAITVQGADVMVTGLVLKRDIYYTQDPDQVDIEEVRLSRDDEKLLNWPSESSDDRIARVLDVLSDPERFPVLGKLGSKEFPIHPGRYMMMGDNSPQSSDARRWGRTDVNGGFSKLHHAFVEKWAEAGDRESHEVPESLLIGKAFFVYWPHGVPFWPNIPVFSRDFRLPFRPYFERMKWIR